MIQQMGYVVQGGLRQQLKLETQMNHLANVNTTGFKADIVSFDEMLRAKMTVDFTPGDLQQTGNDLDLALGDDGFFKIQTPDGVRYTRNGTFSLNADRMLVTQSGDLVLGDRGPILIEGTHIEINEAGEIRVDNQLAGNIAVVAFAEKEKLAKEGESLFAYTGPESDETVPEKISVLQGALESSNVRTVMEMTKMVETMRSFESCMKILRTLDETDTRVITELGRPT